MSGSLSSDVLQDLSLAIERIAEKVGSAVVGVGGGGRIGSGIVWDGGGHVITAHHIVHGLDEVEVGLGDRKSLAKVIGSDPRSDIALLQVEGAWKPIEMGDSSTLRVGQFVLALANPFASGASITSGVVTSVGRTVGGWWGVTVEDAVVSDARVNPGYSGGPLVDTRGRLLGVNIAYVSSRAVTVPIQRVSKVIEKLAAGKAVPRAYLGVVTSAVPLPPAVRTEAAQRSGLMVLSVERGSPAESGGIAFGDVLLNFNGRELTGPHELGRMLAEDAIGTPAKLRILRGGKREELTVVPGEAPED
jgi:S1-C subfamily serine protease